MEDLNIKCNNINESKFIEKWFLNNSCEWNYYFKSASYKNLDIKTYPIIIYNVNFKIDFLSCKHFNFEDNKVIEAKHIMRQEKLKRIE